MQRVDLCFRYVQKMCSMCRLVGKRTYVCYKCSFRVGGTEAVYCKKCDAAYTPVLAETPVFLSSTPDALTQLGRILKWNTGDYRF